MPTYKLFSSDTEVSGQALMDFEQAIGGENFSPILDKHGLTDIKADEWYPGDRWVAVLNEISEMGNSMFDFVSIGIKQISTLAMPPELEELSLIEKIHMAEEIYKMNYRGTDVGSVKIEIINDTHVKVLVRAFEPGDLWYGAAYGFMKRFAPEGTDFKVYYDTDILRYEQGGDVTVIHIEW